MNFFFYSLSEVFGDLVLLMFSVLTCDSCDIGDVSRLPLPLFPRLSLRYQVVVCSTFVVSSPLSHDMFTIDIDVRHSECSMTSTGGVPLSHLWDFLRSHGLQHLAVELVRHGVHSMEGIAHNASQLVEAGMKESDVGQLLECIQPARHQNSRGRSDLPPLQQNGQRASFTLALVAAQPNNRKRSLDELDKDILARSSEPAQASRLRTYRAICTAWGIAAFPVSVENIRCCAACRQHLTIEADEVRLLIPVHNTAATCGTLTHRSLRCPCSAIVHRLCPWHAAERHLIRLNAMQVHSSSVFPLMPDVQGHVVTKAAFIEAFRALLEMVGIISVWMDTEEGRPSTPSFRGPCNASVRSDDARQCPGSCVLDTATWTVVFVRS